MQESKSMRKRLAEWSKTPEGRVAYEKVAEEMRNEIAITNNPKEPEKPMNQKGLDVTDFCKPIDPGIAQCISDHSWEMLGEDEKPVPNDIDFEQELYNHFGQIKDFTLGMRIGQYFYELGKKDMKEQMLKEAVEGKVFMSFAPGHNQMVMADVDLPTNTKVRIIIVKES